jgi:hypothetical protein
MNSNPKQGRPPRIPAHPVVRNHRPDDGQAFLPDPTLTNRHNALADSDVESFAEEFIASATAGEPVEMDAQDEVIEEEWGGPFLELDADAEGEGEGVESGAATSRGGAIPEPPALHKLPPRFH